MFRRCGFRRLRDYDQDGSLSLLPSLYGHTGFTVTYAPIEPCLRGRDGDGVPDVALGRFPGTDHR